MSEVKTEEKIEKKEIVQIFSKSHKIINQIKVQIKFN
jgi:hypothetical protein